MLSAQKFFDGYLPTRSIFTDDGSDLITMAGVELGSYGRRNHGGLNWVYGTGVAEPRLSQCVKTGGYHRDIIRKAEFGTVDKVYEELREYMDAVKQGNKIMSLVELSDLVGSIEGLVETTHPEITFQDVITMSQATRRSFKLGHRS